ncbi:MAG TPA: tRNA (5-methylaminomethyl-2-thiouridine)(34)-methyltransferase MnmD [Cryomorphaceae bacterium]|nr:tRNA (5-methylaminomethyl-2-thiouridine)(34)-methyltransferase MnmD [Cryomorphaceae bacterium]
MKYITPKIKRTADGSHTLFRDDLDEAYHSYHGALQESLHVFIREGWARVAHEQPSEIAVFELGYGTGLNAYLTMAFAEAKGIPTVFRSIEKFPVHPDALRQLDYEMSEVLSPYAEIIDEVIGLSWDVLHDVSTHFKLEKIYGDILKYQGEKESCHVFYFDAFGLRAQSELWDEKVFQIAYDLLKPGGILVTYASNGAARRAMIKVGFSVDRIPGAPGKREMMRAEKPIVS